MHKLQDGIYKLTISDSPLEIQSLIRKDLTTGNDVEYIYQKNNQWQKSTPICFPFAGKFKNDKYIFQGKEYNMKRHGFFYRISNWKVIKKEEKYLEFEYISDGKYKNIYPFNFSLNVSYSLNKNQIINKFQVKNLSMKQNMYFGFGWHPGLKANLESKILFEQKELFSFFPNNGILNSTMNSKKAEKIPLKNWDFNGSKTYVILNKINSKNVILKNNFGSIKMALNGYSNCLVWREDNHADYVCIEPWASLPDSDKTKKLPLNQKPGIIELKPNTTKEFILNLTILK